VLFAHLRTFTRHDRFAERQPPFARSWPNDWYQSSAVIQSAALNDSTWPAR
jgi:hypothetical protein